MMRRGAPPVRGRLPAPPRKATYVAILLALALAGVKGTGANNSKNSVQQSSACAAHHQSAGVRGIEVHATKKAAVGGGKGQRVAAEDADGPCQVHFSLRAPAVRPVVAFTGGCYSSNA